MMGFKLTSLSLFLSLYQNILSFHCSISYHHMKLCRENCTFHKFSTQQILNCWGLWSECQSDSNLACLASRFARHKTGEIAKVPKMRSKLQQNLSAYGISTISRQKTENLETAMEQFYQPFRKEKAYKEGLNESKCIIKWYKCRWNPNCVHVPTWNLPAKYRLVRLPLCSSIVQTNSASWFNRSESKESNWKQVFILLIIMILTWIPWRIVFSGVTGIKVIDSTEVCSSSVIHDI